MVALAVLVQQVDPMAWEVFPSLNDSLIPLSLSLMSEMMLHVETGRELLSPELCHLVGQKLPGFGSLGRLWLLLWFVLLLLWLHLIARSKGTRISTCFI